MEMFTYRTEVEMADRDAVRAVVESTGFFSAAEVNVAVELVDERLSKGPKSGYEFLFALDRGEGRVRGYSCFGEIACTVGSYDLFWIVVDNGSQGKGLGSDILRRTEALIKERAGRGVYAETSGRPQYEPTRRFYLKSGYECAGIFKDFYAVGDDKLVFRKLL